MKKLIVIGIAVMMVAGLVSSVQAAYDPDWIVNLKVATDAAGTLNSFTTICATKNVAAATTPAPPPGLSPTVYAYVAGPLIKDQRPSFTGATMDWVLGLSSVNYAPGTEPLMVYMLGWNALDTGIVKTNQFSPLGGETVKLYASADGATKGALLWTVVKGGTGVHLDALTYETGSIGIGSRFILEEAAVIPEPGSLLALASGLVGLLGFGIRRRK